MIYKGRERLNRGKLESFYDLPKKVQEDYIKIKQILTEFFRKEIESYVYGSYKHGYWDELSDYDVIIYEKCNGIILDKLIKEEIGLNVNVFSTQDKIGVILIP